MPIVASDSVTYTVTAVGRRGQDTATVVITVGEIMIKRFTVTFKNNFVKVSYTKKIQK
jgi:hypothetical protein